MTGKIKIWTDKLPASLKHQQCTHKQSHTNTHTHKKPLTHLLPSQGLLTCWSHSVPVQPGWQVQVKPRCPVAWQSPWTQAPLWHGWQPGSTPWPSHCLVVLCAVPELGAPGPSPAPKSWSFPLMYRLRRQPWKLVPLRPPELCCRADKPPVAEARSGIPGGRKK